MNITETTPSESLIDSMKSKFSVIGDNLKDIEGKLEKLTGKSISRIAIPAESPKENIGDLQRINGDLFVMQDWICGINSQLDGIV
jgi:hypothetical protein